MKMTFISIPQYMGCNIINSSKFASLMKPELSDETLLQNQTNNIIWTLDIY